MFVLRSFEVGKSEPKTLGLVIKATVFCISFTLGLKKVGFGSCVFSLPQCVYYLRALLIQYWELKQSIENKTK